MLVGHCLSVRDIGHIDSYLFYPSNLGNPFWLMNNTFVFIACLFLVSSLDLFRTHLFFQGYRYKPNQLYLWAHKLCVYCCVIVYIAA
jgi:hypothetical protein